MIWGTQRKNLDQELGLESLQLRRWCRKICLSYNILKKQHPQYLFNFIPARHSLYNTRNVSHLPFLTQGTKNSFFQSTIFEWNLLGINLRNSRSRFIFKKNIMQFIRPSHIYVYIFIDR